MPKSVAILIRHGDYHQLPNTPSALQPFPLNETGFQQARDAAKTLEAMANKHGLLFDPTVESSSQLRAWQTADTILQTLSTFHEVRAYDNLSERSLGSAANLTIQQIEDILSVDPRFDMPPANWKSNSHYRLPLQGAESLMEAGERVATHLEHSMKHLPPAKDGLIIAKVFVGHGASMRHAAHMLGVLEFDEIAKLSMYHAQPVALAYHEDATWSHFDGDWKVRTTTDTYLD